jgi:hypothetical protein
MWEESELDWGIRPDGYTLHLNDQTRQAYIEDYWSNMPPAAPDTYSRPAGSPFLIDVDEETYRKLEENNGSYPFNGIPPKGRKF